MTQCSTERFKKIISKITDDISDIHKINSMYQTIINKLPEDIWSEHFNYNKHKKQIIVFTDGSARDRWTCPKAGAGVFHTPNSA